MASRSAIQVLLLLLLLITSTAIITGSNQSENTPDELLDEQTNKLITENLHVNHTLKPFLVEVEDSNQMSQIQPTNVHEQVPMTESITLNVTPQLVTSLPPTTALILFSNNALPTNGTSNAGHETDVHELPNSDGNEQEPSEPDGSEQEPSEPDGSVQEPVEGNNDAPLPLELEVGGYLRETWMNLTNPLCGNSLLCQDRCEESRDNLHFNFKFGCRCDIVCLHMGDCCQDFLSECLHVKDGMETEDFLFQNGHLLLPPTPQPGREMDIATFMYYNYGVCQNTQIQMPSGSEENRSFWTVSKCPGDYEPIKGTKEMCEGESADPGLSFPVSHRWNGRLIFRNIYCALCHGVALRDILFWKVNMRCHADSYTFIGSYSDLVYVLQRYPWCLHTMHPRIPEIAAPRPCNSQTHLKRCVPEANLQTLPQNMPLMVTLCNIYLHPVELWPDQYANVHCAYCSGHALPPSRMIVCPFSLRLQEFALAPLRASLDFWNGRLEVSANATTMIRNEDGPNLFIDSWETYRNQRHENCWAAGEDPRFQLFNQCETQLCPQSVPLPSTDLSGTTGLCSIRKYKFSGDYGYHVLSRANVSRVYISIEFPGDDPDEISKIINDDVIKPHVGRNNAHEFILMEANVLPQNRSSVVLLWTSEESYLSILQLVNVLQKNLYREFSSATSETTDIKTNVRSFVDPESYCRSGDPISYKNVNLVPFGYQALLVIQDLGCYLELAKIGFKVELSRDLHKGYPPSHIDQVFLCPDSEIQTFCGKLPGNQPQGSASDLKPETIQGNGSSKGNNKPTSGTIKSEQEEPPRPDIDVLDDNQHFRRICYATSAFSQLLLLVRCVVSMFRTTRSSQKRVWYLIHMVTCIDFMLLMILYLIAPNVGSNGERAMGALSHFCWLCFASMAIVHLLDRLLVRYRELVAKHSGENSKDMTKLPILVMEIIIFVNALIVITCLVIDVEGFSDLEIGYGHQSDRLLWVSNQTTFLIAFVIPWAVSLLAVCVMRVVPCFHVLQSDGQETAKSTLITKVATAMKFGSMFEVIFLMIFVIHIVDHFDDGHSILWSLIFSLTSCSFSLWQWVTVWNPVQTPIQATLHENQV